MEIGPILYNCFSFCSGHQFSGIVQLPEPTLVFSSETSLRIKAKIFNNKWFFIFIFTENYSVIFLTGLLIVQLKSHREDHVWGILTVKKFKINCTHSKFLKTNQCATEGLVKMENAKTSAKIEISLFYFIF